MSTAAKSFTINLWIVTAVIFSVPCFACPRAFAIVGEEDISPAALAEIRFEHQKLMEETEKKDEEEKRAYQISLIEEKRKQAASGSEEDRALAEELAKLREETLVKKKHWRDRFRFNPSERIVFDSNIQNQRKKKSDIIFHTGSGVQVDLGTARTRLDLNYDGNYARYYHHPKLSRGEHRLGLESSYPVSSKTDLDASYRLSSTGDQTSEIREVLNRLRQDAALVVKQRISKKTGIRLSQTYSDVFFYRKTKRDDSNRQYVISPEFNYFLSRKTSIFTRYALGFARGGPGGINQSVAHEFRGGIRGKVAPKTTALFDLGYSRQTLKKRSGHTNAFVAETVLISNVTRKTRLELLANRSFSEAVDTAGSYFYVTDNVRLTGITQFRRYLLGEVSTGLRRNTYEQSGKVSGSDQHDLIVDLNTSLRYDFRKWLGLELRYGVILANASDSEREYSKQTLSLGVYGRY